MNTVRHVVAGSDHKSTTNVCWEGGLAPANVQGSISPLYFNRTTNWHQTILINTDAGCVTWDTKLLQKKTQLAVLSIVTCKSNKGILWLTDEWPFHYGLTGLPGLIKQTQGLWPGLATSTTMDMNSEFLIGKKSKDVASWSEALVASVHSMCKKVWICENSSVPSKN